MKHTPNLAKNEDLMPWGWERDASHNNPVVLFIEKLKD
jgi:hypothetical protein